MLIPVPQHLPRHYRSLLWVEGSGSSVLALADAQRTETLAVSEEKERREKVIKIKKETYIHNKNSNRNEKIAGRENNRVDVSTIFPVGLLLFPLR